MPPFLFHSLRSLHSLHRLHLFPLFLSSRSIFLFLSFSLPLSFLFSFFKSYIYIRLRFNYKVRYVSGSPSIVLHTISRDWRVSPRYTRGRRAHVCVALEKQDETRLCLVARVTCVSETKWLLRTSTLDPGRLSLTLVARYR